MTQGEMNVWLDFAKIALAQLLTGSIDTRTATVLACEVADDMIRRARMRGEADNTEE